MSKWRWSSRLTALAAALAALALSLFCAGATWGATSYDPATRLVLDGQHHDADGRAGVVERRLHRQGRRRRGDRHRRRARSRASTRTGKVVNGPDLSLESQAPNLREPRHVRPRHVHGRPDRRPRRDADRTVLRARPASAYRGIAPDARIVSLKVATADGGADVTPGDRGDRLGRPARARPGPQHPRHQPLLRHELDAGLHGRPARLRGRAGLEEGHRRRRGGRQHRLPARQRRARARRSGVRPVRDRRRRRTTRWAPPTIGDDAIGAYSASSAGCGAACKNPDFVAPGSHLQGLRVPNSLHRREPSGGAARRPLLPRLRHLQAAAVTSGAVALDPPEVPDPDPGPGQEVPHRTTREQARRRRRPGAGRRRDRARRDADGDPAVGVDAELRGLAPARARSSSPAAPTTSPATASCCTGEQDIFGKPFDSAAMATAEAAGNSWSGGTWNGSTWSGSTWSGNTLVGQHVERQQLERQQLVAAAPGRQQLERQQLVAATPGAATPGAATPGAATAGRAAQLARRDLGLTRASHN